MAADIVVKRAENAGGTPTAVLPDFKLAVIGRSLGADTSGTAKLAITGAGDSEDIMSTITDYSHEYGEYINSLEYITDEDDERYMAGIQFSLTDADGTNIDPKRIRGASDARLLPEQIILDWSTTPKIIPPAVEDVKISYTGTPTGSKVITWYCVTVVDKNGNESSKGGLEKVSHYASDDAGITAISIILSWSKKSFASGYVVYRTLEDFGNTEPSNSDFKLISTITDENETSFDDDYSAVPGASPPADNTTRSIPKDATSITISYHYADMSYNTPVEYYSWEEVKEAHGVGSELTNVARLFMSSSFNNLASLTTIVPGGTSLADYNSAVDRLATENVHFILMLYAGSITAAQLLINWAEIYAHCLNCSDPETGQKERRAVLALPNDSNASVLLALLTGFQAKDDDGKSAYLGVVDNFGIEIDSWIGEDGEYSYNYTHDDPADIDITPLILAGACVAKYLSMGDLAEPLTEKSVAGFTFTKSRFSLTQIQSYSDKGALVIKNSYGIPVVYRSVNMSLYEKTLEDGEMNICTVEDFLKQDLRLRLSAYRGKKMTDILLSRVERAMKMALDYYVNIGLINTYDPSSVAATKDATEKDRLNGEFKYMPMYPVNQIWITFGYTFEMS